MKRITQHFNETPEAITREMRRRFTSPDPCLQSRKSISVSNAIGEAELHFYRGHSQGVFDSYLTLKDANPKAAKALLRAYSMRDVNGEWQIG